MPQYTLAHLREYTRELKTLVHDQQKSDMRIAALLVVVYDNKLYKLANMTWAEYCGHIGLSTTTAKRRMRIWRIPALRESYTAIGYSKANEIVQTLRDIANEPNAPAADKQAAIVNASIEKARNGTLKTLKEFTQAIRQQYREQEQEQEQNTLETLMARQDALEQEREMLLLRLAEVKQELADVAHQIATAHQEQEQEQEQDNS